MKEILNIGIIDDDKTKITSIINKLYFQPEKLSPEKKDVYDKYEFKHVILEIFNDKNKMIEQIHSNNIDCVIVDYKLSSYSNVSYDGTELSKYIEEKIIDFPVFLLTSFEDDLYANSTFNSFQVFDFNRYYNEPSETIEFNYKMIQQIKNYHKQLEECKEELLNLIPEAGMNAEIDDRIFELNKKIKSSISHTNILSKRTEKIISSTKMDEFLEKVDQLLEEL